MNVTVTCEKCGKPLGVFDGNICADCSKIEQWQELDKAIERYTNNTEYERQHGNLQGCLEFRQLAEWLKDYKRLLEQEPYRVKNELNVELNELRQESEDKK